MFCFIFADDFAVVAKEIDDITMAVHEYLHGRLIAKKMVI